MSEARKGHRRWELDELDAGFEKLWEKVVDKGMGGGVNIQPRDLSVYVKLSR